MSNMSGSSLAYQHIRTVPFAPRTGPFIKVDSLGDSSVNILFRVHAPADKWWDAKLDLTKAGKEALEAAGKSIPYPQRDVHIIGGGAEAQ